jgi:hypothetical protein
MDNEKIIEITKRAEHFIENKYHSRAGLEANKLIEDKTGKEVSFEEIAEAYHEHKLKLLGIGGFVRGIKRTLERKEAAYACVNTWYEKEYDSSTPDDEVASMDIKAAELNAQIKVLRYVLSEAGEL